MRLEINEDTLRNTSRCKKQFVCLTGEGQCLCKAEYCLNGKVCFIRPGENLLCNYKVTYQNSFLCSCPTRKEIYNSYNM